MKKFDELVFKKIDALMFVLGIDQVPLGADRPVVDGVLSLRRRHLVQEAGPHQQCPP